LRCCHQCGWKNLKTMTPLKRWMVTEMRWNKNEVSRGSSVNREIRWPRLLMNSSPTTLMGPSVSNANG